MVRRIALALLVGLVLTSGTSSALWNVTRPGETIIACQDEVRCPDLSIDPADLEGASIVTRTFLAADCAVIEGATPAGTQRLLQMGIATPNIGSADLIIGSAAQNPTLFEWGACHGHWHYIAYATLRLWTMNGYHEWSKLRRQLDPTMEADHILDRHPHLRSEFVAGSKVGYCIINIRSGYQSRLPEYYVPSGHAPNCNSMGITVGRADVYARGTEGQWVVVTNVPSGTYMLEAEVNANRLFAEIGDWRNNHAAVQVTI